MRPHGESKVMESTITRSGEHTTLGLLAEQSLVGCLLGAVGDLKGETSVPFHSFLLWSFVFSIQARSVPLEWSLVKMHVREGLL